MEEGYRQQLLEGIEKFINFRIRIFVDYTQLTVGGST